MPKCMKYLFIGFFFPLLLWAGNLTIYSAKPAFEGSKDFTVSTPSAGSTVIDTVKLYDASTATIRRVRIGRNFNGPNDDTIRVVTVQSGTPRKIITLTDTSSGGRFVKFRSTESSYAFPSGSTPCGLEVGDFDGDYYIDLFAGTTVSPFRFYWLEWNGTNFVSRDSTGVSNAIYNIAYADGDNDGTKEAYFPSGSYLYMVRYNNGLAKDSISLGSTVYAIAVGDVNLNLSGNEVYVAGTNLYRVYWNGSQWDVQTIYSGLQATYSAMVGDVDYTYQGNELVLTHGSTTYQVSVWNWNGSGYEGRAWDFTESWSNYGDLYIGDVSDKGPVSEVLLVGGSTSGKPTLFWMDSDGIGYYYPLPEPSSGTTEFGVCAGNVNKYTNYRDEFVVTGGGHVLYYHERYIDLALTSLDYEGYILKEGTPANFTVRVKNQGTNPVTGFSIAYAHKNHVEYSGSVSIPANDNIFPFQEKEYSFSINYGFTGTDTILVYISGTYGEQDVSNDTLKLYIEVWPESTMAAATFNSEEFPPNGWSRVIVSGDYNWERYTAGTAIVPDYVEADPLEGAGMAGYPFFDAEEGSSARLITNAFNVGDARKRVVLRFYMTHSDFYSGLGYDDSLIVEYKIGSNFIKVSGFAREIEIPGSYYVWLPHEVVLGDFSGDSSLAVSLLAVSGFGENMFVDSVWVFTAAPGPEFVFNENTDIGKFTVTDNYWVRIKPENSSYGIDSCFLYYELSSKAFTKTLKDSIVDGYYYFTIENPTPGENHSVSYYFEFYDDSPWKYCNRYPLTGTLSYNILPITDKLPTSFALGLKGSNISPGLFNISYAIPERSLVEISVYSVNGRKIATLVKGTKDTGYYTVRWDGRSDTGSRVGSGIYIIKMETPKKIFTEKLIITR